MVLDRPAASENENFCAKGRDGSALASVVNAFSSRIVTSGLLRTYAPSPSRWQAAVTQEVVKWGS